MLESECVYCTARCKEQTKCANVHISELAEILALNTKDAMVMYFWHVHPRIAIEHKPSLNKPERRDVEGYEIILVGVKEEKDFAQHIL